MRSSVARVAIVVIAGWLIIGPAPASAQSTGAPPIGSTPLLPPPAKDDHAPVQHGTQPNPGEVRPGSEAGDSPSAAAGALSREQQERRIFGLPITAAIVIAGVLIALGALAAAVAPRVRRRDQARGGGTYGRPR